RRWLGGTAYGAWPGGLTCTGPAGLVITQRVPRTGPRPARVISPQRVRGTSPGPAGVVSPQRVRQTGPRPARMISTRRVPGTCAPLTRWGDIDTGHHPPGRTGAARRRPPRLPGRAAGAPGRPGAAPRACGAGRRALLRLARLRVTVRLVTATTMSAAPSASALLI